MIRLTYDWDYIDNLEDFYRRNECIREQQYLSREKLLHLAAFCLSKVVGARDSNDEPRVKTATVEAALDSIRQLSLLCDKAGQTDAVNEPAVIVNGRTNDERKRDDPNLAMAETPTLFQKFVAAYIGGKKRLF